MPSSPNTEYASAMSSTLVSDVPSVNEGHRGQLVESTAEPAGHVDHALRRRRHEMAGAE